MGSVEKSQKGKYAMRNTFRMIILVLILIPSAVWAAPLDYQLEVAIDTVGRKITGKATLTADPSQRLSLSIGKLHHVKVNGKAVAANIDDVLELTAKPNSRTVVTYEAHVPPGSASLIDPAHVFLSGDWFPVPDTLAVYHLTATLPEKFVAVAEADSIRSKSDDGSVTYWFHFNHPLDRLTLAASTRFTVSKDVYRDIALETYFFQEDSAYAGTYLAYLKKYLQLYEDILPPYPYKRFAVVETLFPTGTSMPTFTLLGQDVIRLPFIVQTSLGHEVLHQWFGNSVFIDLSQGNWAEGLTTYLSDHYLAVLDNRGREYRKQIMVDYAAYVKPENAVPIGEFYFRGKKAQRVVGYGKSAMFFHDMKKRFGEQLFYAALNDFIQENQFEKASWNDIQTAFEKVTGKSLGAYFDRWINKADIPFIRAEAAELVTENGGMQIQFKLRQSSPPYALNVPVTIYYESGARIYNTSLTESEKTVRIPVHDLPLRICIDEGYDIMRQLAPEELPPSLAAIMGSQALTVVVSAQERSRYQPLIEALGVPSVAWLDTDEAVLSDLKNRSLVLAGYDNDLMKQIAGKRESSGPGVYLTVINNPFDSSQKILLAHVSDREEALAIQKKLRHYGKYSELIFNQGAVSYSAVDRTENGIPVFSHKASQAVAVSRLPTLNEIIPEIAQHPIIYVGEQHDKYAHHINQLLIIKALHDRGIPLAVGMEMFKKPYQQVVDDYLAGRLDERRFLKDTDYFNEWGYNFHLYKPIVDYLKQQHIPLVALNLKGDITGRVAHSGLEGLSETEKAQVPEFLDFSNQKYREDLKRVFQFHGDLKVFNYFLQAQVLWDEGMAENAHIYLQKAPQRTLVILAGNGHLKYKYGIPQRLYRRNQLSYAVVLQDEALEGAMADYVLVTDPLKEQEAPKLGVSLKKEKSGLTITGVLKDSPAQQAGLQKGDVIQALDRHPIASLGDLRLALFFIEPGHTTDMVIQRDGDRVQLSARPVAQRDGGEENP